MLWTCSPSHLFLFIRSRPPPSLLSFLPLLPNPAQTVSFSSCGLGRPLAFPVWAFCCLWPSQCGNPNSEDQISDSSKYKPRIETPLNQMVILNAIHLTSHHHRITALARIHKRYLHPFKLAVVVPCCACFLFFNRVVISLYPPKASPKPPLTVPTTNS